METDSLETPSYSEHSTVRCKRLLDVAQANVGYAFKQRRLQWFGHLSIATAFWMFRSIWDWDWDLVDYMKDAWIVPLLAYTVAILAVRGKDWPTGGGRSFATCKAFIVHQSQIVLESSKREDITCLEILMEVVPKSRAARLIREEILKRIDDRKLRNSQRQSML